MQISSTLSFTPQPLHNPAPFLCLKTWNDLSSFQVNWNVHSFFFFLFDQWQQFHWRFTNNFIVKLKMCSPFLFFLPFVSFRVFFLKFCSNSSQIVAPLLKQFIDLMHGRDEWICCKPCDCSFSCCLRNLFLFLFILGKFKLKELWHF